MNFQDYFHNQDQNKRLKATTTTLSNNKKPDDDEGRITWSNVYEAPPTQIPKVKINEALFRGSVIIVRQPPKQQQQQQDDNNDNNTTTTDSNSKSWKDFEAAMTAASVGTTNSKLTFTEAAAAAQASISGEHTSSQEETKTTITTPIKKPFSIL